MVEESDKELLLRVAGDYWQDTKVEDILSELGEDFVEKSALKYVRGIIYMMYTDGGEVDKEEMRRTCKELALVITVLLGEDQSTCSI